MTGTHKYDPDEKLAIGEAARSVGVSISTLRRWESEGKLRPERTPGGQRRYRRGALDQLLSTDAQVSS